jgi:hypothetical protein
LVVDADPPVDVVAPDLGGVVQFLEEDAHRPRLGELNLRVSLPQVGESFLLALGHVDRENEGHHFCDRTVQRRCLDEVGVGVEAAERDRPPGEHPVEGER